MDAVEEVVSSGLLLLILHTTELVDPRPQIFGVASEGDLSGSVQRA